MKVIPEFRGVGTISKVGGLKSYWQIIKCMPVLCEAHMRSMPNLGGSGGMPPQKILKIYTL